jgi:hypothetical protein
MIDGTRRKLIFSSGSTLSTENMNNWKRIVNDLIERFVPTSEWIIKRLKTRSASVSAMVDSEACWFDTSEDRLAPVVHVHQRGPSIFPQDPSE